MAKKTKKTKAKKPVSKPSMPANKSEGGIQPLGDRVLVKRVEAQTTSAAGIIIPDTASKDKSKQGVIVAVGPGKYEGGEFVPTTVKIGEKVFFNAGWDNEVKLPNDEAEYFLVHENEILAIIG